MVSKSESLMSDLTFFHLLQLGVRELDRHWTDTGCWLTILSTRVHLASVLGDDFFFLVTWLLA